MYLNWSYSLGHSYRVRRWQSHSDAIEWHRIFRRHCSVSFFLLCKIFPRSSITLHVQALHRLVRTRQRSWSGQWNAGASDPDRSGNIGSAQIHRTLSAHCYYIEEDNKYANSFVFCHNIQRIIAIYVNGTYFIFSNILLNNLKKLAHKVWQVWKKFRVQQKTEIIILLEILVDIE